jgi:hypothetical protein
MLAPISGGLPVTIATLDLFPSSIAADDERAYWTEASDVMSVNLDGGSPEVVATGLNHPCCLVLDSTSIYWVNSATNGSIMRAFKR